MSSNLWKMGSKTKVLRYNFGQYICERSYQSSCFISCFVVHFFAMTKHLFWLKENQNKRTKSAGLQKVWNIKTRVYHCTFTACVTVFWYQWEISFFLKHCHCTVKLLHMSLCMFWYHYSFQFYHLSKCGLLESKRRPNGERTFKIMKYNILETTEIWKDSRLRNKTISEMAPRLHIRFDNPSQVNVTLCSS